MEVRPLHDYVVVEVLEGEERVSAGGIIYSHGCEKTHKKARVLRCGPGKTTTTARPGLFRARRKKVTVEPGQHVIIEDWRVKWHSGVGQWPGPGDRALLPADACALLLDGESVDSVIDVTKVGVVRDR